MKRFGAILLAVVMLAGGIVSAGAEETITVSYDFDVRFQLEEQEVPYRMRERMQAYREMLNVLEIKGNVTVNPDYDCLDLRLELVPVNNPSASVMLRLYGRKNNMCVESPLLGEETYYLGDTERVMGFASQLWTTLGIPFPSFFLLDPFLISYCFSYEQDAWRQVVHPVWHGEEIPAEWLATIRDYWAGNVQEDTRMKNWLNGLYAIAPDPSLVERAVVELPDTLVRVTGGDGMYVKEEEGLLEYSNKSNEKILEIRSGEQSFFMEFCPPDTEAAYRPYCLYSSDTKDDRQRLNFKAAWDRNGIVPADNSSEDYGEYDPTPASLLQVSVEAEGIPVSWPAETKMTADLVTGGYILPDLNLHFDMDTAMDGSVKLTVSEPSEEGGTVPLLTADGSVTQVPYEGELYYYYEDLFEFPVLLVATHDWATEALGRIVPNMVKGLVNFVYELPIRSCQVLLDDLEELGLLGAILAGN